MSMLDLIVVLVLILTVVRGLMLGMVATLFSLAAWVLAFVLGKWGALIVAPLLPIGIENPAIRYFAGFAVIFLLVLIGVLLLGHALASLVKAAGLGSADKVLGGVLGLAKGLVILIGLTLAAGRPRCRAPTSGSMPCCRTACRRWRSAPCRWCRQAWRNTFVSSDVYE